MDAKLNKPNVDWMRFLDETKAFQILSWRHVIVTAVTQVEYYKKCKQKFFGKQVFDYTSPTNIFNVIWASIRVQRRIAYQKRLRFSRNIDFQWGLY